MLKRVLKGGGILVDSEVNKDAYYQTLDGPEKFKEISKLIWTNPNTRYERIPSNSIGGFLYKVILADDQKNYMKKLTAFEEKPVHQFLLKVVIMSDYKDSNKYKSIDGRRPSSKDDFMNECEIQNDIFNGSYDMYLEPICPFILTQDIIPYSEFNRVIDYIKGDENEEFKNKLIEIHNSRILIDKSDDKNKKDKVVGPVIFDIGLIFMEYLDNSIPLAKYFPLWKTPPSHNKKCMGHYKYILSDDENVKNNQLQLLDIYIYELIRLWKLGYIHGDNHLDNAMYIGDANGTFDYDYINNKRLYLIDFGLSRRHNFDINSVEQLIKNVSRSVYWSYLAIKQRLNILVGIPEDDDICERELQRQREKQLQHTPLTPDNIEKFRIWYLSTNGLRIESIKRYLQKFYTFNSVQYKEAVRKLTKSNFVKFDGGFDDIFNIYDTELREDHVCYPTTSAKSVIEPPIKSKNYTLKLNDLSGKTLNKIMHFIYPFIESKYVYHDEIPNADGIYTFVIYKVVDTLNVVFFKTLSFHELATKHGCIMFFQGIKYYYSAGELKKEGNNVFVNYMSGTYMGILLKVKPDTSREIVIKQRELYEKLVNISNSFLKFICDLKQLTFNYADNTFITKDIKVDDPFCEFLYSHLDKLSTLGVVGKSHVGMEISGGRRELLIDNMVESQRFEPVTAVAPKKIEKLLSPVNKRATSSSSSKKMAAFNQDYYNDFAKDNYIKFSDADFAKLIEKYDEKDEYYSEPFELDQNSVELLDVKYSENFEHIPLIVQNARKHTPFSLNEELTFEKKGGKKNRQSRLTEKNKKGGKKSKKNKTKNLKQKV